MSIYVSSAYALVLEAEANADFPVIGHHNVVTASNVTASQEDAEFPGSNLANPSTVEVWKSGSTSDQTITVTFSATEVDYVGIARHNLGSGQVAVTVEGTDDGVTWIELVAEQIPADDTTILFRWEPDTLVGVRLSLAPGSVEPQAGVLYVGKLLVFERGVQAHMPIVYARSRTIQNVQSVGGDFLGRVVIGGKLSTTADFKYLSASWFRSTLDPFLEEDAAELPFFFAWSPQSYPAEVGFVWLTGDATPTPADLLGRVNLSLPLEGILT